MKFISILFRQTLRERWRSKAAELMQDFAIELDIAYVSDPE